MAKKWFAAGCGQTLSNVQSAKRLAHTLPFQTQVFSNASLPPDLKLELSTVLLSAVFRAHALWSAVFVFYFIVRSFRAERNICIALDSLDVLQDTNVIGRSFRLSAVTVTGDEGNADAPGSSCDRKAMQMPLVRAAADGREIPILLLYVYLTYCPCYINKSQVSRRVARKYSSKCRKLARQTPALRRPVSGRCFFRACPRRATRPIASQRSAPRSPRSQTLCCRPIHLASGAIPRARQPRLALVHTRLRGLEETPDRNLGFSRIVRLHSHRNIAVHTKVTGALLGRSTTAPKASLVI